MTPAEAQKLVDQIRTKSPAQVRLRVVGSVDNPDADGTGAKLQARRREMGLSVVQVAQALKLRPDQIAAIETMEFSRLPGLGYALGYVKAYAELLDFPDVKVIVDDYKAEWLPEQSRNEANRRVFENRLVAPIGLFILLGLLAYIIFISLISNFTPKQDEKITRPDAAIKEWSQKDLSKSAHSVVRIDPIIGITASRKARLALRSEDGALVMDRYVNSGETVSTDGLGRFLISADDAGAFNVSGYGYNVTVGANHTPIEKWRVPDFKAMADAKAAEEAKIAAEAAAANAPKTDANAPNANQANIAPNANQISPVKTAPKAN